MRHRQLAIQTAKDTETASQRHSHPETHRQLETHPESQRQPETQTAKDTGTVIGYRQPDSHRQLWRYKSQRQTVIDRDSDRDRHTLAHDKQTHTDMHIQTTLCTRQVE